MTNINTKIATNYTNIQTLQAQQSTNRSNITQNTQDITTNTSKILTNKRNTVSNLTDINTNKANIATNTSNISINTSNIASNTSTGTNNRSFIDRNLRYINRNGTNIGTNVTSIQTKSNDITSNITNISANTTNISSNTSKLTTNTAEITSLKNKVGALTVTHTLTKSVHTGSRMRKAGRSTAASNQNVCVELTVPSDGSYLITYHVIFQPTNIYYNTKTFFNTWYFTNDSVNLELHTALYHDIKTTSSESVISGTNVSTDGGHYNRNNPHHIFRQAVYVLGKDDKLNIKSLCNDFTDDQSYLYYNAREAQISILKLSN